MGSAAKMLFGVGLLGATLLAGAVLPLATAYAVSEAFGVPKGVNLDFRRGKVFFSFFTALIIIGRDPGADSKRAGDAVAGGRAGFNGSCCRSFSYLFCC